MPARNPLSGRKAEEKIAHREKVLQAIELRKAGVTLRDIATRLGWNSPQAAHKSIRSVMDSVTAESVGELRALQAERLDALLVAYYPQAVRGDVKAAEIVLKVESQRARLFGLEAPEKHEVKGQFAAFTIEIDRAGPVAELMIEDAVWGSDDAAE